MSPQQIGYRIGIIIGALALGALLGLVPLILAKKQGRDKQGWIAFFSTITGSLILGLFLSLPISTIFSLYIFFTKKTEEKT